ncbi:hypothetical protein B0H63DRAFT_206787 [Podospora didyma]|uniref:Secreted protein n=1 Tax=Podospora didyma TaxID=330526 RepID=A0AAE0NHC6_9PEZI|nr:hypothetical protein B0H63DRAFT_206787 [Podospora didyma]
MLGDSCAVPPQKLILSGLLLLLATQSRLAGCKDGCGQVNCFVPSWKKLSLRRKPALCLPQGGFIRSLYVCIQDAHKLIRADFFS